MMGSGWMLLSLQGLAISFGFISQVRADDLSPYLYSKEYDDGELGEYPQHKYKTTSHTSPILNYAKYSPLCDDGKYIMLAPRGGKVHNQGPMIVDGRGDLVWYHDYGHTYGTDVHMYKGESYLTFWSGDDGITGHGDGTYYLIDSEYREAYKFGAGRGLPGDLHEFHITNDGTAVFTIYDVVPADISSAGGPEDGWLWDGTFQEVDIETGDVLFQWRASEHIPFSEANRGREGNGESEDHPWDFFHINSIDKDSKGNFLISSRYMGSLTYINGTSGDVIWKIGGKDNRFEDLSDGGATNMTWQHHARFHDDGKTITLFDNQSRGAGAPQLPSRGLHLEVDDKNMTVRVKQAYWNPLPLSSQSQGSMQILDDGKVFMGYGYIPAFTEYSADGEVLCDVHFGPETGFGSGDILSYRAFKRDWVGKPTTDPDIAIESNTAYVSWNGATEVASWVLQGADSKNAGDEEFNFLAAVVKSGFETEIQFPEGTPAFIRVAAVDADGLTLAHTEVTKSKPGSSESSHGDDHEDDHEDAEEESDDDSDNSDEHDDAEEEASTEDEPEEPIKTEPQHDFSQPIVFLVGFVTAVILGGIATCVYKNTSWFRSRGHTPAVTTRAGKHEWNSERNGGDEEEALAAAAAFAETSDFSDDESEEYSEEKRFSDDMNSPPDSPGTRRYNGEI